MEKKEWQVFASALADALGLAAHPVAVSCVKGEEVSEAPKVRICRAILDASQGASRKVCKKNNACFGAAWHLGFHRMDDEKMLAMTKKFVVEGEKLFSSYEALETLIAQMEEVPDNSDTCFLLSPLKSSPKKPQLVIFVCNPDEASRLLTLVTFGDGRMPTIKIGGPTCRMIIIYPLLKREVNISFYDYTARKICNVPNDKLLVSIPYERIPAMVESIDRCTAGRAKIEYPPEFRAMLQKRLAAGSAHTKKE